MDGIALTNGHTVPQNPKQNGLSLTEYSSNLSPSSERPKPRALVPRAFLMENGHPDVQESATFCERLKR